MSVQCRLIFNFTPPQYFRLFSTKNKQKMKFISTFSLVLGLFMVLNAQNTAPVKWYKIEEAEKTAATEGKKIMVKVYANWCGWCKEMDKSTFPNPHVAKILNESFISVQFNSEQLGDITWGGTTYKVVRPRNSGRYHQLAAQWLNGNLSFPTIVIFDTNGRVIQAISGYRKAKEFEKIIAFFANDAYKTMNWTQFEKQYKRA
jgi:thioredoxin-related protein